MDAGHVQLMTAAGSSEEAERIAAALLESRLAACVQIVGPMISRYWWEGSLESAREWLVLAKTTGGRADEATQAIVAAHSYDVPEVTALPIVGGHAPYLAWIAAEISRET